MSRKCSVCIHPQRDEINKLLIEKISYRDIARRFNLSKDALSRHKAEHLPKELAKADEAEEVTEADHLLEEIQSLRKRATTILNTAEKAGDLKTALLGIREARGCVELLAKIEGQLNERPQITIINNPEWIEIRTLVVKALDPFPKAKEAVVLAIHGR